MTRLRCAILDDYFNLALDVADWQSLSDRIDVTVFSHPFASEQAAASALAAACSEVKGWLNTVTSMRSDSFCQSATSRARLK